MLRKIAKSITFLLIIGIIAFGTRTLYINGNFPDSFYPEPETEQLIEQTTENQAKETKPPTESEKTIVSFKEPIINNTDIIFKHNIVPHNNGSMFTTIGDTKKDNQNRIQTITIKYDKNHICPVDAFTNQNIISKVKLVNNQPFIYITNYTWNNAMSLYLNAINQYIQDNDELIGVIYEFQYVHDDDIVPTYIKTTIFTINNNNVDLAISFYNYDKQNPIDFVEAGDICK